MQIHPAKWRARLTAEGLVVVAFLAHESEPFEVQVPLQMLRQMVQIFREILGRPAGKETQPMAFQPVRYQTDKNKPPHIKVATVGGGVGLTVRTAHGLDADMALTPDSVRHLIRDLQTALTQGSSATGA